VFPGHFPYEDPLNPEFLKLDFILKHGNESKVYMYKKPVRIYNFTSSATIENGSEGSSLSSIKLTNACEPVNHKTATRFI